MGFDDVVRLTYDVTNTITQKDKSCASSTFGVATYVGCRKLKRNHQRANEGANLPLLETSLQSDNW